MMGIDLGPHAAYISVAYLAALVVLGSLIVWLRLDARRQMQLLADLEARGIRRRSASAPKASDKKAAKLS